MDTIRITNDCAYRVGYVLPGFVPKTLEPFTTIEIDSKELLALASSSGGRVLLEEKMLLLDNTELYQEFGIYPNEDDYTTDEIIELVVPSNIQELDDILSYCSDSTLDKIITHVIASVDDYNIIQLVQNRTKKDITSMKQEAMAVSASQTRQKKR
jgi:hypothetical protein